MTCRLLIINMRNARLEEIANGTKSIGRNNNLENAVDFILTEVKKS